MSRNRVEKRPQAIRDLADIAVYLAEESGSDEVAFRFLDAAEASFESLAATPEMGSVRRYIDPALVDVRMWRVAGFPNHRRSQVVRAPLVAIRHDQDRPEEVARWARDQVLGTD